MTSLPSYAFDHHRQLRQSIVRCLGGLTLDQLNRVPSGLNNNIVWNAGHVIATQELLVFALGGHRTPSGRDFIDRYRKGTRPEGPVTAEEVTRIRRELLAGHDRLREAYATLDWSGYRSYTTSLNVTVQSVEEAVAFNNLHEGLHLGTILAQRRLV